MPRHIEIEGELVTIVSTEIIQSVPLSEWLPKIERRIPMATPVLPTNTRAVWWDSTDLMHQQLLVLMEREPQVINMNLSGTIYALAIPWTRFLFHAITRDPNSNLQWSLSDYRIYWSNKRYTSPTDRDMLAAMVPNVYDDGRICFGSTGADANQILADRLDQTVNEFYVSTFNHDLTINRPNNWRGWTNWVKETRKDPMSWMTWTDWTTRTGAMTSWNLICEDWGNSTTSRNAPMVAANPIPDVPMGATFGRINEWIGSMTPEMYRRLHTAVVQNPPSEMSISDDISEEEEDDEDA